MLTHEELIEADEAGETIMVSEAAAKREIRLHHLDPADFFNECPGAQYAGEWSALAILEWLGY